MRFVQLNFFAAFGFGAAFGSCTFTGGDPMDAGGAFTGGFEEVAGSVAFAA